MEIQKEKIKGNTSAIAASRKYHYEYLEVMVEDDNGIDIELIPVKINPVHTFTGHKQTISSSLNKLSC